MNFFFKTAEDQNIILNYASGTVQSKATRGWLWAGCPFHADGKGLARDYVSPGQKIDVSS